MPEEQLVDITKLTLTPTAERIDNANQFLAQIHNHKRFEVNGNVVNLNFTATTKTLASALRQSLEKR